MMIWESSSDLLRCTNVPEVVGTEDEILSHGIVKEQEEYTPIEWLRSWENMLETTILCTPAEEHRRKCVAKVGKELIRRRCA